MILGQIANDVAYRINSKKQIGFLLGIINKHGYVSDEQHQKSSDSENIGMYYIGEIEAAVLLYVITCAVDFYRY